MAKISRTRWALLEAVTATVASASVFRFQLESKTWLATLSAAVWIYLPLALLAFRRLPMAEHGFALAAWRKGGRSLLWSVLLLLVPFNLLVLSYRWLAGQPFGETLAGLTMASSFYQLAIIVIPEELFFRGYLQGRLRSWSLSHGLESAVVPIVLTAGLFALAHVLVEASWLRAAVFFPGLVMGWLRERSGGMAASAGFHWLANLSSLWLGL